MSSPTPVLVRFNIPMLGHSVGEVVSLTSTPFVTALILDGRLTQLTPDGPMPPVSDRYPGIVNDWELDGLVRARVAADLVVPTSEIGAAGRAAFVSAVLTGDPADPDITLYQNGVEL